MGREVGGGIGMGNTRKSWLIHVNVWQKSLQYCKVISLQLIKINEKNIYIFSWAPKSLWMVPAAMKLKDACSLEERL